MALTKQAKMLSKKEVSQVLDLIKNNRYSIRDKVMVLLSFKAGLRAVEISNLRWSMVTDASGAMADYISLTNQSSKGKNGGRIIPLNKELKEALVELYENTAPYTLDLYVIKSAKGARLLSCNISHWFRMVYKSLRLDGCSSHSGRRTFLTLTARKAGEVGGCIKDVQYLAGHASLATTQKYIVHNEDAINKLVQLV